jgi:RNA-directed DNA polymerase
VETTIAELAPYRRGWGNYFDFCETPEAGVPHALGPLATASRGVATVENTPPSSRRATRAGGSSATGRAYGQQRARPWYLARAKALSVGLSNAYFDSLGLSRLIDGA